MKMVSGPVSHITNLAAVHREYCIQMVNPWDLKAALDSSTDLRHDLGETMQQFPDLLVKKMAACTEWFHANLEEFGIQEPIVVIIHEDGRWQMDEGHHRLAWGLLHKRMVPVIFDDSGLGDESIMGFLVSRENVTAYHDTTEEDLIREAEILLVEEVEDFMEAKTVPIPVQRIAPRRTTHRISGRHRA